jgi:glycosyltransferase involved in cell wall biosynthesis
MKFDGLYVLTKSPPIISYIGKFADEFLLSDKQSQDCLIHFGWYMRDPAWYLKHWLKFLLKGKHLHFMCNSRTENWIRRLLFLPGILCNHNSYVDEHVFKIKQAAKKYDAIYNARMDLWKRHELAGDIKKMFVATYEINKESWDFHEFCPPLKHAEYNKTFVSAEYLVEKYNQSRVGLCLSAEEGAMFSSMEYLLCGLPIVSTPSVGGRDEFFDDRYVKIVKPTREAVAAGVAELISRDIDPEFIRTETLKKIKIHRYRLIDYVITLMKRRDTEKLPDREVLYNDIFGQGAIKKYVQFADFAKMMTNN